MSSIRLVRSNINDVDVEFKGKVVRGGTFIYKEVNTEKYTKMFPRFLDLLDCSGKPALKIIIYVCRLVQDARFGHDTYCFNYLDVDMGKVNFYNGIRELLEYQFLYKTHIPNQYKINTKMILNGKRKKEDDQPS